MSACLEGHDCIHMYMFGCVVNGVCVVLQLYWFLEKYSHVLESV